MSDLVACPLVAETFEMFVGYKPRNPVDNSANPIARRGDQRLLVAAQSQGLTGGRIAELSQKFGERMH